MSQIEEIRAKRAALAAKRAEREEAQAEADAVAEELRLLALEEAVEAAEAEHGRLHQKIAVVNILRADGTVAGSAIVKRPHVAIWRRYQDLDNPTAADIAKVISACRVWPSAEQLDVLVSEYPAANLRLMTAIMALAGAHGEETKGKS